MKFSEILDALKRGEAVTNGSMSNKSQHIVRQIPQVVPGSVVPKMTSLPESGKQLCDLGIEYHDQVLLLEWDNEKGITRATSYVPTWEDIFREDWTIC